MTPSTLVCYPPPMSQPHDPEAFKAFPHDIPHQTMAIVDIVRLRERVAVHSILKLPDHSMLGGFLLDSTVPVSELRLRQEDWLSALTPAEQDVVVEGVATGYRFNGLSVDDIYRALPTREVEKPVPYSRLADQGKTYTKVESPLSKAQVKDRLTRASAAGTVDIVRLRSQTKFRTPQLSSLRDVLASFADDQKNTVHDRIISFYATQHYLHVDPEDIRRNRSWRSSDQAYAVTYDVLIRVPPRAYAPDSDTPNTEEVNQ